MEKMPSAKEQEEIKKERALSDLELVKGGAQFQEGGRMEATAEQVESVKKEMEMEKKSESPEIKSLNELKTRAQEAGASPEDVKAIEKKIEEEKSPEKSLEKAKEAVYAQIRGLIHRDAVLRDQERTMMEAKEHGKEGWNFNPWKEGYPIHDAYEETHKGFKESKFGGQNTWKGLLADSLSLGITNMLRRRKFNKQYNERLSAIQEERRKLQEEEKRKEEERKNLYIK